MTKLGERPGKAEWLEANPQRTEEGRNGFVVLPNADTFLEKHEGSLPFVVSDAKAKRDGHEYVAKVGGMTRNGGFNETAWGQTEEQAYANALVSGLSSKGVDGLGELSVELRQPANGQANFKPYAKLTSLDGTKAVARVEPHPILRRVSPLGNAVVKLVAYRVLVRGTKS